MNVIFVYAVFASLCIHSDYCQKPASISDDKPVKVIGATANLVCLVVSPVELNISWVKDNGDEILKPTVLTYGNRVVVDDSRFSLQKEIIREVMNGNRYILMISDLIKPDTGSYRCQALYRSENLIFNKIELIVRESTPPRMFNNMTTTSVVMEGRPLILECYASGFPEPTIYWGRENNKVLFTGRLTHRGNIFEIPVTKKGDRGIYYCFAENGIRPSPRRTISVVVEFPPFVSTSQLFNGQALGYFLNLDCRIEACPPVSTVVWMYKGLRLTNNRYYKISNTASSSKEVVNSNLRINLTDVQQYGDYFCKTSNMFGDAEIAINLHETRNKKCPPACE